MEKCQISADQFPTVFFRVPIRSISNSTTSPLLEPGPLGLGDLEQAAGADRAGADHVAGQKRNRLGSARKDVAKGPIHILEIAARSFLAVHAGTHHEIVDAGAVDGPVGELIGR